MIPSPYDETGRRPDESLFAVLAAAARRRSDAVLAIWAGSGCVLAAVLGALLPEWRVAFLAAICAAAFGFWGIADRELGEASERGGADGAGVGRRVRALRIARVAVAVLGTAAGALALLAAFAAALGTWIS